MIGPVGERARRPVGMLRRLSRRPKRANTGGKGMQIVQYACSSRFVLRSDHANALERLLIEALEFVVQTLHQ